MPRRTRDEYLFSSTNELLAPRFSDELTGIGTEGRQKIFTNFWAVTDPLFLTEENEALLEHYSRMSLANVLFSLPVAGIRGWKTDRGKALLRFGMPHSRVRLRPGIEVGSVMQLSSKTELWFYPDFVLGFTDEFNCGNYRFSVPDEGDNAQYDGNARQLYEDLSRTAFYHCTPSFRGTVLAVPATVFRFRCMESSIPGDLEVAIAYTMPLLGSMDQDADAAHTFGVFLFDEEGRRLFEKREQIGAGENDHGLIRKSASGPVLLRCPTFYSSPDSGILSLEWIRTADGATGIMRKRIRLEALEDRPELSDIVFATTIARDAPHLPLQRGRLGIAPYPWAHFGPNSTPSIYFEVYDLGVDEEGRSDFDVLVTLRSRDEDDGIFGSFESLLEGLGLMENPELTTTTGYMTEGPMAQLYMQIDFSAYTPGAYELRVRIVDHIRGEEIERRVPVDLVSER
jgi:GWxTD domain-containing protein